MKESSDERNHNSVSRNTGDLEPSVQRQGRHGVPDYCRVGDLHDLRRRVPLLCRKEPYRTDSSRGPRDAYFFHRLFIVQQPYNPPRVKTSRARQARRVPRSVVSHHRAGRSFYVWHSAGMAPAYLRTWSDYLHQSFWNDLLFACWSARDARHGRSADAHYRASLRFGRASRTGAVRSHRRAFHVLAFCGCSVGCCFYRGLRFGSLRRTDGNAATYGTHRAKLSRTKRARGTGIHSLAPRSRSWIYAGVRATVD